MRMILARLTILCGVFPSAISCCSCSRAFRDSSCSIREMNHDHTRDSNVRDRTLALAVGAVLLPSGQRGRIVGGAIVASQAAPLFHALYLAAARGGLRRSCIADPA